MKIYQVKIINEDSWGTVEAIYPEEAAEIFAEENGYDDGNKIRVKGFGTYLIRTESEFFAEKI